MGDQAELPAGFTLVVRCRAIGFWTVRSDMHPGLLVAGASLAEALAAVPGRLAQLAAAERGEPLGGLAAGSANDDRRGRAIDHARGSHAQQG